MATTFRISLHAESKEQAEAAADAAFKRIAALNAVCSDYEPNSELMRLVNTGPHLPFRASDDLFTIITRALELSRLTDGAFDITCGNLSHLWRRIYGMNFEYMPELKWHYGYFGLWALMLAILVALVLLFRKQKWL